MTVKETGEGYAVIHLEVKPELKQVYGKVHGGVLASLVDSSIGLAAHLTVGEREGTNTASLTVHYIKPVDEGELIAEGRVVHRGRTTVVGVAEVRDGQGKLVAIGSATLAVRSIDQLDGR